MFAGADGYGSQTVFQHAAKDETAIVGFSLVSSSKIITGRVANSGGAGIAGVYVSASRSDKGAFIWEFRLLMRNRDSVISSLRAGALSLNESDSPNRAATGRQLCGRMDRDRRRPDCQPIGRARADRIDRVDDTGTCARRHSRADRISAHPDSTSGSSTPVLASPDDTGQSAIG